MNQSDLIKVLLIEDDEDDYFLAKGYFREIVGQKFQIDWASTYDSGLQGLLKQQHDIYLVDYRLGAQNGIDLLRIAIKQGCKAPIILLTGQGEHEIDLEAMKAGAADYLVKARLDSVLLGRSIRYALERRRAAAVAAADQARLAAFGADVGLTLTRRDSLEAILTRCANAMVNYLNAGLARIWTYEPDEKAFKLMANEGPVSQTLPAGSDQPKVLLNVEKLTDGKPVLITQLIGDPRLPEQEWAQQANLVAYAGYPLILENRVVGLMSLFSRTELSHATLQEMGSVANGIALCIERKRSESALDASEFKYRSVVENIKEVIFQVDVEGRFTFLNPAWMGITGFKLKDSLGTHIADYMHPEDRERHWELFTQIIQRRHSFFHDECRYLARDGTFRWVEVYAQPILEPGLFGTSGTIRDITERKRAEAEIQKLAAFVRLNPNPVMELAADGTVTYLNQAAHEMAGVLELADACAILPQDTPALARECLRLGNSKHSQEITISNRTLSWSFFPIVASQVVHCYGTDITDRLNLETQLRHAQKLESIGQLAAGVAHDFNNILTIVQGHADRLLSRCKDKAQVAEALGEVSLAAQRGSGLTRQLLMFSRKQVMQPKTLDLNAVLRNMTNMLPRLLGEDVDLEATYATPIPAIEGDTGMLEQVLMNLSVNARDAMPKGGRLRINTSLVEIDSDYVRHHPDARPGKFVCLTVGDTGCGMDTETLQRIFEPFFTTKEVGKGTGLGLATVYGIVKQHQGWVQVSSQIKVGTTFEIFFPASSKPVERISQPSQNQPVRGGTETILLVEDEPVLRELARAILQDYDYRVLEASNGVEALKVWEQHQGQIDLLLTDMVMPQGISGRELAQELKTRKPALKVIYTSGYSSDVMGNEIGTCEVRFLQKPYPPPQLAHMVRECLDIAA